MVASDSKNSAGSLSELAEKLCSGPDGTLLRNFLAVYDESVEIVTAG